MSSDRENAMKAMIAMSGGVDSSVAAYLMKERGYACTGVTMRLYRGEDLAAETASTCCSQRDIDDAAAVAAGLQMPHEVSEYTADFKATVIADFVATYAAGGTPNPCIECNRRLKFGNLLKKAVDEGYDAVATGHYARVVREDESDRYLLKKAADTAKDQSYVLYTLPREHLDKIVFPLGELTKDDVRAIAAEQGFSNAAKPDSQDICFVPDGDYVAFIEAYTGKTFPPGDFLDVKGNVIGRHRGIIHYTIGQRRGIGIAASHPLYVAAIDATANTVTVAAKDEMLRRTIYTDQVNLLVDADSFKNGRDVAVKYRYNQKEVPATAVLNGDKLAIRLATAAGGIACGQSAVIYDGDTVLGGGIIRATE